MGAIIIMRLTLPSLLKNREKTFSWLQEKCAKRQITSAEVWIKQLSNKKINSWILIILMHKFQLQRIILNDQINPIKNLPGWFF